MEKIFKIFSQISANLVFGVLVATVVVLYITAKPAIEQFGAYFMIDSRWSVDVKVDTPNPEILVPKASQEPTVSIDKQKSQSDVDSKNVELNSIDLNAGIDDDIPIGGEIDSNDEEKITVYGGAIPIVGTLFSTAIAMLFSIPIAMGIAVFLSEIATEKLKTPVGVAIELLAAIPSIIYGMWALFYFGPFISSIFGGHSVSLLVAGLVLGVMVIPFMAALSRDAINTTPDVLKESAYAMGATKFEVVKDIIFPYAKAGIIGSVIISLGRAMGETMAVAFVIGGVYKFAGSVTDPTISIPVVLANNFSESSGLGLNSLFYLALILFVISFIVIFTAKHVFLKRNKL